MIETPKPLIEVVPDVAEDELAELPWWRRPRRLRRQLAGTLVLVALISVLLAGGLNYVAAENLLSDGTKNQLEGVGEARARSIEAGIDRTLRSVSALAADLALVEALARFDEALLEVETEPDADRLEALTRAYQDAVIDPINAIGLEQYSVDQVLPTSPRALYLQSTFIEPAPLDLEARQAIVDPGDGTAYSEVHADVHENLLALGESLGLGDLKLISARTNEVVYSTHKRFDLGADLSQPPFAGSTLSETVLVRLPSVRVGEAVLSDLTLFLAAGGEPMSFVAASVRRDTEVIGVLVVELPTAALDVITTANESWEEVGLSTGESYVVSSDRILRSQSRAWIDDPAKYLARVDDDATRAVIEALDSPVGVQVVDTEPVEAVLDGGAFTGTSRNYLGQQTFTYATAIDSPGVDLMVVADIPLSEARAPLVDYAKRLGLVLIVVLPLAAIVGLWLARRLTRPIAPVVDAALAVANGERNPNLDDLGNDEFGDLARRLGVMARELEDQEHQLEAEYERRRQLLLTVLPSRMVEEDGGLTGTGEVSETATVIAVSVEIADERASGDDEDAVAQLGRALETAEAMAAERGIERIRSSIDRFLFLAGVGQPGDSADEALVFASQLTTALHQLGDERDLQLNVHVGLSSGLVGTGVLQRGNLTFAAWGEPVRRALAIGALSQADEVLIDQSTKESLTSDTNVTAARDVVALDGQPMALFTLEMPIPVSPDARPS